jgi:hypothetical protein
MSTLTPGGVALPSLRRKERRWLGSQRLTTRPWPRCRRPPRPPAASWSTSPGCWRARPFLERQGVADRCALYPGDLFALPPAADLYLLASVLHDWDDPHAARILAALGRSATTGTRLRIFEMVLPTDATPHRAKMSDVLMLLMFDGARERTVGQYRDLLEDTGWQLEQVMASPGPMSVIQARRSATS